MSTSRRAVLGAMLGVPAALLGCRGKRPRRAPQDIAGGFVARPERIGHRLRDGETVEPPPERWERAGVVIVGGGVAGLSAAWRLLDAGVEDLVVLELDRVLGGTAQSGGPDPGSGPGFVYPWGAHYVTAPMRENRALVKLLDEMSVFEGRDQHGDPVVAEQHLCRDPDERVFYRGRWYSGLFMHAGASATDEAQYAAFQAEMGRMAELRDGSGRRAFALPTAACSDDAELMALDRVSMAAWMDQRGYTSPRLRWYADYACRDDYGLGLDHTSAWAGLLYYASRLTRVGGDYQPIITWPEGNGRVVAHLAARVGARARTGWAVAELRPVERAGPDAAEPGAGTGSAGPGGPSGVDAGSGAGAGPGVDVVALTADGAEAAGIRAQHVIYAGPQFLARYLIRPWRERAPDHLSGFDYGPWMVANLHLSDRPRSLGFPLAWDNILYDSRSLGYVVSTHQRGLDHGRTVLTYYYPLLDPDSRAARRRLLELDWADWAELALTDLERAHPGLRTLVERVDVMRWGHAMVRPHPGFVSSAERRAARSPFRNIHFAHSDLSGVAIIDEAVDHGVRAAEEVLAARGIDSPSLRAS